MTSRRDAAPASNLGGLFATEKGFPDLLLAHYEELKASALSDDVIRERGYRSVLGTGRSPNAELGSLGFNKTQASLGTGILLPLHSVDGQVWGHQFKPDRPRTNSKGRAVKYESPQGQGNRLDVPPRCKAMLGDPSVLLFIAEGAKKADALADRGLCVLNLRGVFGFKGRNEMGGVTLSTDFDLIALKGRDIYLAFDSDIIGRAQVRQALDRLSEHLRRKGANIRITKLPPGENGEKVGVDDYFAAGYGVDDLLRLSVLYMPEEAEGGDGRTPTKGWRPAPAAKELLAQGWRFAKGGGQLYRYKKGVYEPGEEAVKSYLPHHLGDVDWNPTRADAVVRWLYDTAPKLWDRPPLEKLNLLNGILNLETGILEPHSPDYLCAVQLPVPFNLEAKCPTIERFIGEVFPPDVVRLAYEIAGWLCTPDTWWQKAMMLVGTGANGRSTYLNLLTALLGKANVTSLTLQDITDTRFGAAELYGRLANVSADLPHNALRSTSLFKMLTGGDRITAERKYGQPFSFEPFARLVFSANEPPATPDGTYAFFRRWIIVPFPNRFEGKRDDKRLLTKLTAPNEVSGFLNLALAAYARAKKRTAFTTGESLDIGMKEFKALVDAAAAFLQERVALDIEGRVDKTEFYRAFKDWCETNGIRRPLSAKRFNDRVRSHLGVDLVKVQGRYLWRGIRLGDESDGLGDEWGMNQGDESHTQGILGGG